MSCAALIESRQAQITRFRRHLHTIPELGYQESKTAAAIRAELDRFKIAYTAGVAEAETATIAVIGDTAKPCVALRADIDALPVTERTGLEYSSTHDGRMHACGHDGHAATLLGAASVIQAIQHELPVCVKFIWQPAEEGGGGAEVLVNAGVLDGRIGGPKVSAIFGMHGWPGLKVGTVATKRGAVMAATDDFSATFVGRGGHGAYPHLAADPVLAACEAVMALQQVVSRETDPTDSCVITVGKIAAGTAINVIPDTAQIAGTVRTLAPEHRTRVKAALERRLRGIAHAGGCELGWQWNDGYPPTINDPDMADYVAKIARQALGNERFIPAERSSMAGEDFSYYLQQVPGCFFYIGLEPLDIENYPSLHSDRFDFTDAALAVGMRMFVELVMNWKV